MSAKFRELTSHSVLHDGMRVAVTGPVKDGRSNLIHVGTVVQPFGDGAHVEYDYEPGHLHLHPSIDMVEVLPGSSLMAPRHKPIRYGAPT